MSHQERRNHFVESNPGFAERRTPLKLWGKLFEETREAMGAFFTYARHKTPENRHHLGEELADVVHILTDMASYAGIDLQQSMNEKLSKDEQRFPPGTVIRRRDYKRRKRELGEI
jgi:NTP pyrophosphatase (non-canonical NTP hydrolase)